MNITTKNDITWSTHVLRLSTATVPAISPNGIDMKRDRKLTKIVGGSRLINMPNTGRPGRSFTETPKSSPATISEIN